MYCTTLFTSGVGWPQHNLWLIIVKAQNNNFFFLNNFLKITTHSEEVLSREIRWCINGSRWIILLRENGTKPLSLRKQGGTGEP